MSRRRAPAAVVVGRGRMGATIARALREAGSPSRVIRGRALHTTRRGARPVRGAALWVLAVTDRAVADVAAELVAREWLRRGDAAVHLAGMLPVDALAVARAAGASVGALHPLVAVADPRRPPALRGAVASFEGDPGALRAVRAMAREVGLRVVAVRDVDRARYHAGAALMATGAIALAQGAAAVFAGASPSLARAAPGAERALREFAGSLLASAAHNVRVAGAERALASPLMRGDTGAVARHLAAMAGVPAARALYAAALDQVLATLETLRAIDADVVARARDLLRTERELHTR